MEPTVSAELVREIASQLEATIQNFNATLPNFLPGYRVEIFDSNAIEATERCLKVLPRLVVL